MITESQARPLAAILHELRPSWSGQSMLKLLEAHHAHPAPFPDIALAAINAARDPKVDTPGCIFIDSRFWPVEAKRHLPKPDPCEDHIGQEAHNCRSCWGDFRAGLRPQDKIGKRYTPRIADELEASMEDA